MLSHEFLFFLITLKDLRYFCCGFVWSILSKVQKVVWVNIFSSPNLSRPHGIYVFDKFSISKDSLGWLRCHRGLNLINFKKCTLAPGRNLVWKVVAFDAGQYLYRVFSTKNWLFWKLSCVFQEVKTKRKFFREWRERYW